MPEKISILETLVTRLVAFLQRSAPPSFNAFKNSKTYPVSHNGDQRPAVGIGLEICTLCDLRFASDKAKMGEVAVPAVFCHREGTEFTEVGRRGRAIDMILTGKIINADEALETVLSKRFFPRGIA